MNREMKRIAWYMQKVTESHSLPHAMRIHRQKRLINYKKALTKKLEEQKNA